jgi:hypothetical protein
MKKLLKQIDQKCDDRVADFHNSLMILFLIQVVSILIMLGVATSPLMFFQDNLWLKLFGGMVLLFSPISVLNAVYLIKSASWHFWNTLENRMCEWFD